MFAIFGLSQYFDQGSTAFFFLCVDCECNQPSFLVTVFESASVFNRDLNQWDVAKVTTMHGSKSIRIVENDLSAFFKLSQGSSVFFSCALTVNVIECDWPSFLGTVFYLASAFNRDLDQWDVATVTSMFWSKSIRILENDLA